MTPLSLKAMRRIARGRGVTKVELTVDERSYGERPRITFTNQYGGGVVSTTFADARVLARTLRMWRSLYGAHLVINGKTASVCLFRNTTALIELEINGTVNLKQVMDLAIARRS